MKVAQTELNEAEYRLLVQYAEKQGLTLKDALREAARRLVLPDRVDPDDPLFTQPPVAPRTGRKERTSEEHDKYLYGEAGRSS